VPGLNPVSMDWSERIHLATHPALIAQTMNIYTNGFTVIQPMKDSSVHWLAAIGLSDYRFLHVDVYSLPAFLDGWLHTRTIDALYRVPAMLVLEMSLVVWFIRSRSQRLEAALMVLMAASLLVFLTYGLVWEYHYTGLLPVAALFLIRNRIRLTEWIIVAMGVVVWLPSLYLFVSAKDVAQLWVQTIIRLDRVVPAVVVFFLLLLRAGALALESGLDRRPILGD
jgi:hypothetical protein